MITKTEIMTHFTLPDGSKVEIVKTTLYRVKINHPSIGEWAYASEETEDNIIKKYFPSLYWPRI